MSYQNESTDRLFALISLLDTQEECRAFFEDLCTIKEIQDMAQRLDTAFLLAKGESYISIAEKVKVSTATISRVNRALSYGCDGYKNAIAKMEDSIKTDKTENKQ
ncbi:MAG: hypothetical protein J5922_04505 [Clostridia bacterium]|nr:hypothetical protein [Clostridia bacterium]